MPLFFGVLLAIVIVLVILASAIAPFAVWEECDLSGKQMTLFSVFCVLVIAGAITLGISLIGNGNPAEHCSTGTTYQERYNVATKTTDWWCVGR
jgi:multisubunit Na+/H+ antiporter MnhB subunit